jgi:predicted anti-sigma-YlaC factor YlaD
MKCNEVRELMPDMALGLAAASHEAGEHLRNCADCAGKLDEMRKTMALLDEWQAPEPSAYFDTRMRARFREEKAKATAPGWMSWVRKPALAALATGLLVAGVTFFRGGLVHQPVGKGIPAYVQAQPGTPVGDLQALDKNDDLYSDFDVLDDLTVQQDVNATP